MRMRRQIQIGDVLYTLTDPVLEGMTAARDGVPWNCCPYPHTDEECWEWEEGHALQTELMEYNPEGIERKRRLT